MTTSEADQKEYWTTSKIVEELHHNLISSKGEDGLRKYEEKAKTLLYKIPICMDSKQGDKQAPSFNVEIKDLSE